MDMIKGFLTNLGKYNEGELIGEWISFPIDEDELEAVFKRIGISDEPDENGCYYEEYFFTDWECEYSSIYDSLGEYVNISTINELAEALEGRDIEDIAAIMEATGCDLEEALDRDDYVFYRNMTLEDVAEEIVRECYDLPEFALRYFDFKAFAHDLSFDNYYEVEGGTIFVN